MRHFPGVGLLGALALVIALAVPAHAQNAPVAAPTGGPKLKLQNRKTKDIKLEKNERTEAMLKAAAGGKPAEKPKGPDPTITADRFWQIETQIQGDVDDLVATLAEEQKEFEKDDPRWIQIGFQLAEAYSEKVRYHHSMSMEALIKYEKAAAKDKAKWKASLDAEKKKEKEYLLKSIQAYKKVIDNPASAKFPQVDEVIFYYAFTLSTAGYKPQAREVYKILLTKYQGSRFVPDAYQAFADHYFEERDLGNALAFYDKVLQFPKAPIYPFAVYKKGWVLFNLSRFDESMKQFYDTIQITKKDKKNETLGKAAKKDFVRAYSESESAKVEQAYRRFQQVDPTEYSFKMLGMLGDHYLDQGKSAKAIYVFHQLLKEKPKSPEVCDWQYKIVQATIVSGTSQQKVDELSNLIKLYTHVEKSKQVTGSALSECYENAAATTAVFATNWHAEGIKTLNPDTLGLAHQLYHVYLDNFERAENALDMSINYAELLWTRATMEKDPRKAPQRWEEAALEHSKVVQMKGVTPAQKKDSAYAAVIGFKNALAVDPTADEAPQGGKEGSDVAIPLTDKETKMISAFDLYLTYVQDAKDEERTAILFFKCRMYFKHNLFDQAIPLCGEILQKRPDHETAYFAMNIVLNSLERSGKGESILAWVDKLLANKKFIEMHPDARPVLDRIQTNAATMRVRNLEKSGQYRDCAYQSEKLYRANPNAADVNQTLFNTALCFEKAKLIGRAILYRQKLQELPNAGKDPLAQQAQMLLGDNYTQVAMYEQAAKMYENYASRFGGEKDAPKALQYAYAFRLGLGQDDLAIKNIDLYVDQYGRKDAKEAAYAVYSIADIYQKNRDTDKMVKHLQGYIRQWGSKGGVDLLIAAHVRLGEVAWRESCPLKNLSDGSCVTQTRGRALKGKARRLAESKQCGQASKNKIVVTERKPAAVKEAQRHFNTALKLWKGGEAVSSIGGKDEADKAFRANEAARWVGAAMFNLAELKYEKFLAVEFPEKLDFTKKKKDSDKRFGKFIKEKAQRGGDARKAYDQIFEMAAAGAKAQDPRLYAAPFAIAGKARIGQIAQNSGDALWTAEIPSDVRRYDDSRQAYCDAMQDVADPLEKLAVESFSFCLDVSNQLNWFNEWSQLCERELAQIRPQDFPTAGEVRAAPDNVPMSIDTQTILAEMANR